MKVRFVRQCGMIIVSLLPDLEVFFPYPYIYKEQYQYMVKLKVINFNPSTLWLVLIACSNLLTRKDTACWRCPLAPGRRSHC